MQVLKERLNKTDMEKVGKSFELCPNIYLMYLCEMTGAKEHIYKYQVLQCSKLFYSKVSSGFLPQNSQRSYSFGKVHNAGGPELSEEKS